MRRLGDRGHGSGRADAVRAHGHDDLLAVLVEHLEVQGLRELAAELEDVTHLDAAGGDERPPVAVRARVSLADRGRLDGAVAGEVAAGHQVEDVTARLVRPGDPPGPFDHPWVEQVAHTGRPVCTEGGRADVATDQTRGRREVVVGERLDDRGMHHRLETLLVDVAVTRQPDGEQLLLAVRCDELDHDVLQRVGSRPVPVRATQLGAAVGMGHQRLDGRCVGRVLDVGGRHVVVGLGRLAPSVRSASTFAA